MRLLKLTAFLSLWAVFFVLAGFVHLLGRRSVEVLLTIQPKIECFRYADNSAGRKKLAKDCYNRVLGRSKRQDRTFNKAGEGSDEAPSPSLSS